LTPEQLQAARAERWRQKQNPALTLDDVAAWIDAMGLCLFLPRRNQFLTPAPSFVEACIGAPSDTPSPAEIENARGLMIRLAEGGTALPLNLFGVHADQPDSLASREAFPYIFSLRGGRNWKTPPPKATPLVVETWKLLEPGAALEATEIQAALGREITEAAVLRGLFDLWGGLRVMPVYTQDGPTRWELTQARFSDAMTAANKIAQTTGLSALVSLYLQSVIAATPEEIETLLSPLTARSKVREVVNGLTATRQLAIVPVGTQTMVHVAGSLPEFEEPEPETAVEAPKTEPRPAYGDRRSFGGQRPPFRPEWIGERPGDRARDRSQERPKSGPPRQERFAAREGDRGQRSKPPREGERRDSRPFRKFDQVRRPERYSPGRPESGTAESGERRPFKPRRFEDGRAGGKFPPKKFGAERERTRFEKDRERPQGVERERPPKKFGGKRPFYRGEREESRPRRDADRPRDQREDRSAGSPQRRGEWKPSRFGKSGKPKPYGARPGEARPGGSRFKGQRRDREDHGGRPEGGGQRGKFYGKKFGGPQSRGKSGGFKSGPRSGGTKPPGRNWKDKKWKNKGKKSDGKNPE
jgi:23S rRNA pseudouridine2605 synthase